MLKRQLWVLLFVAMQCTTCTAAQPLCQPKEVTWFSCETKKGKVISLCASRNLSNSVGYLQYRFGTESTIELQYPEQRLHPRGRFFFSSVSYSRGVTGHLTFANGPYRYVQYDELSGNNYPKQGHTESHGVLVLKRGVALVDGFWPRSALITNIECTRIHPTKGGNIPDGAIDNEEFINLK